MIFKGLTDEEARKIREAINRASSLDEVERLQKILQSGQIPGHEFNTSKDNIKCISYHIKYIVSGYQHGNSMDYE